ncbi:hypothetical protein M2360_004896 [Rhizobium sp. SG_E_25_P2]|uniref:penicillin-binding transpeptidase domain-containing protein n=1 Tax=Rhizobium sp. SG_E_25_P2 TaxID=2879942 RepID=UPI002476B569|nr:penicillin-binding transpeptidase domain-containing protein [Rhizobium sp. SG_E_25_P2]MDH6269468.1 hypothetical protein [Rhizobium sp. SG_E_25_P2]
MFRNKQNSDPRTRVPGRFRMSPILVTWLVSVGFVVTLGVIMIEAPRWILPYFSENRNWVKSAEVRSASALVGDVFQALVKSGAVWPRRRGEAIAIAHAACNTLADDSPETVPFAEGKPAGPEGTAAVRELCNTSQGERIRQEIAFFNRRNQMVAIRDDRLSAQAVKDDGVTCAEGGRRSSLFVPAKCIPNAWKARLSEDGRPAALTGAEAIPIREYAFMASTEGPFFGDWAAVVPVIVGENGADIARLYDLSSQLLFAEKAITIETIGQIQKLTIGGEAVTVTDGRLSRRYLTVAGRRYSVEVETWCNDDKLGWGDRLGCNVTSAKGRAIGSRVRLTGPRDRVEDVSVTIALSSLVERGIRVAAADTDINLGGGTQLRMTCKRGLTPPDDGEAAEGVRRTGCRGLGWNSSGEHEHPQLVVPVITAAGSKGSLLDDTGMLTEDAFKLGMADFIGFGVDDGGSLASVLAGRSKERSKPIDLTIDLDMQARAQDALEARKNCNYAPPRSTCIASLVIMEADGRQAGDVLAAVSTLTPPRGLSMWDIITLETAMPARSPLAAHAWRGHDFTAKPGSTFKVVTALAAMQEVLDHGDQTLTKLLLGTEDLKLVVSTLGLAKSLGSAKGTKADEKKCDSSDDLSMLGSFDTLPVTDALGHRVVRCLTNSDGPHKLFGDGVLAGTVSRCDDTDPGKRTGVCESLIVSSNLFFGGLALLLDAEKLVEPGSRRERHEAVPDLLIAKMSERLFPNDPGRSRVTKPDGSTALGDCPPGPADAVLPFDPFSVCIDSASRLATSPLVFEAALATDGPRKLVLAQGGFGLTVRATPMVMASILASIATGKIVRPHLLPPELRGTPVDGVEGQPLLQASPSSEALKDELLDQLRRGLWGVANVKTGTATSNANFDSAIREHVFSKTGTANLTLRESSYASWLVGYVEPPGGASGITRRLAFACRVAPTANGGASACGPIIARFFNGLHKERK